MNSKLPNTDSEADITQQQGGRLPVSRYALFFLPCLIGVTLDLTTKWYMFGKYFEPNSLSEQKKHFCWIDGVFGIQTSTNPGALFGIGSGHQWLFAIFSIVALVGILVWLFFFRAVQDRWLAFALGLISGGILGNLYDRIGLGYVATYPVEIKNNVRDWILFELDGVPFFDPWPNFNIADSVLVAGAIMLFIHAIFYGEPDTEIDPGDPGLPETKLE